jgi:hypothetical protein
MATNTSGHVYFEDWRWVPSPAGSKWSGKTKLVGNARLATLTGLPKVSGPKLQIMPSGVTLDDGTRLMFAYGSMYAARTLSSFLFASSDDGLSWQFRKSFQRTPNMPNATGCDVGPEPHRPPSLCGPCEPAIVLLPDRTTLVAVFRLQSNLNLWQATSKDGGFVWSTPVPTQAWAVFPQMRTLNNGAVVLTSGRPSIGLWLLDIKTMS